MTHPHKPVENEKILQKLKIGGIILLVRMQDNRQWFHYQELFRLHDDYEDASFPL